MHPAFSVLLFTVTAGVGFGLLFCLLVSQHLFGAPSTLPDYLTQIGFAVMIYSIGLMSSTFHLANPKNAWRSFARFKTSWLSKEGVLAVMSYPILMLYVAALLKEWNELGVALAIILLLLLIALTVCTAMIYRSLKTIPQWHNAWVIPSFLILSFASGLVLYGALNEPSLAIKGLVCVSLLACGGVKLGYFRQVGAPDKSSIQSATGFSQASVTLFDSGHSSRNFSEREFMYEVGPKTKTLARRLVIGIGFGVSGVLMMLDAPWGAFICLYLGLLLERWLFFVEAKHVIRHFYDQA